MKPKLYVGLIATLSCLSGQHALAAACTNISLEGARTLATNCNGTCGAYEVGTDLQTDLGFGTSAADLISFEFFSPDSNPPATGTFDLGIGDNGDYATCFQCVLVHQDLNSPAHKTFFQTAGTITIDAATVPGVAADLALTWSNITLAEVTIDPSTYHSTLVPGGACFTTNQTIFANGFDG